MFIRLRFVSMHYFFFNIFFWFWLMCCEKVSPVWTPSRPFDRLPAGQLKINNFGAGRFCSNSSPVYTPLLFDQSLSGGGVDWWQGGKHYPVALPHNPHSSTSRRPGLWKLVAKTLRFRGVYVAHTGTHYAHNIIQYTYIVFTRVLSYHAVRI